MSVTNFHLTLRDAKDLKDGCPECIYRAYPGVGVFKSEESFLAFLRVWYAPRYGECNYLGVKHLNEKKAGEIERIYPVNYEVVGNQTSKRKNLTGKDLEAGTAAIITSPGIYEGQLVIKCDGGRLQNISDAKISWLDGENVCVRLLAPGEERIIRGR